MEGPVTLRAPHTLVEAIGKEVGVSPWVRIDQAMIAKFADLTDDHFYIHLDAERAKRESPFGGTIAHGFLTLSMLASMAYQAVPYVEGTRSMVNYGFDRLRFVAPVPSGSRVRGRFTLADFEFTPGDRWRSRYDVVVEIEGGDKPAIVAQWLHAGFF